MIFADIIDRITNHLDISGNERPVMFAWFKLRWNQILLRNNKNSKS